MGFVFRIGKKYRRRRRKRGRQRWQRKKRRKGEISTVMKVFLQNSEICQIVLTTSNCFFPWQSPPRVRLCVEDKNKQTKPPLAVNQGSV